jgi:hypothetical protein
VTEHEARETPPSGKIDITVPHSARIWNYWLGGKDNYTVDRAAGDAFREIYPDITVVARALRAFLARAVRHLAGEADIRQFLDVGTGLPTADNTHEVAQRIAWLPFDVATLFSDPVSAPGWRPWSGRSATTGSIPIRGWSLRGWHPHRSSSS